MPCKIFTEGKEKNYLQALADALDLAEKTEFLTRFKKVTPYPDEPQFWHYRVTFQDGYKNQTDRERLAGGFDFVRERALLKALGEALERYSLVYRDNAIYNGSFMELSDKGINALNPTNCCGLSDKEKKEGKYLQYLFDGNSNFKWVEGYDLRQNKSIYLPAQLVYVPYDRCEEPIINTIISTGAASWTNLCGAIYNGICEVVERDSYLITYLNKLPRTEILLERSDNPIVLQLLEDFSRYRLEVRVFETITDIAIYSFMAVIIDKTGIGPAVCVGLKAGLDPAGAVIGAILEAQHVRVGIRSEAPDYDYQAIRKSRKIEAPGQRSIYWSKVQSIRDLDFLLKGKEKKGLEEYPDKSTASSCANLKTALDLLKDSGVRAYFVDITHKHLKDFGFYSAKVIIPQCMPFNITEPPRLLGCPRLYEVPRLLGFTKTNTKEEDLNDIPHPFY